MSRINYPLPYWWDYTVSGQQLPDFYWNVKSQEERIKKICEDLWKLIELYKMLVDAINDHEERISTLESQMAWVLEQINKLYQLYNELVDEINRINETVNNLGTRIENIENILADFNLDDIKRRIQMLEEQVDDLEMFIHMIESEKMDKQYSADLDNIGVFDNDGQIVDSNINIHDILTQTDVSNKMDKQPSAVNGHFGMFDNNGQIVDSNIALSDLPTQTDISNKMDKQTNAVENNLGKFDANGQIVDAGFAFSEVVTEPETPIADGYILKSLNNRYASTGLLFSERYLQVPNNDETQAAAYSLQHPLSLVYTEEEVK